MKPTSFERTFQVVLALTCILSITAILTSSASAEPIQSTSDTVQSEIPSEQARIAAREDELRRKEAELIKSMGMSAGATQGSTEIIEKTATVSEIKEETSGTAKQESAQKEASRSVELVELKAIRSHPALESKKAPSSASANSSGRIRTHSNEETSRDDTARRLDSFRRVDSRSSFESTDSYGLTKSKIISLNEIEQDRFSRPMPIQEPEVATIGLRSARLRTGPSTKNVTLVSLPEYSEVAIDYRSGDWYRIKTPTGMRGWIQGRALLFDAGISPSSTIKIGAVRAEPGARVPR
jgi:hypothetical protein